MKGVAPARAAGHSSSRAAASIAGTLWRGAGALTRDSFTWGLVMEYRRGASRTALEPGLTGSPNRLRLIGFGWFRDRPRPAVDAPPAEQRAHRLVGLGERLDGELGAQQILEALVFDQRRAALAEAQQALDHREPGGLAVLVDRGGAAERRQGRLEVALARAQPAQVELQLLDPVALACLAL